MTTLLYCVVAERSFAYSQYIVCNLRTTAADVTLTKNMYAVHSGMKIRHQFSFASKARVTYFD